MKRGIFLIIILCFVLPMPVMGVVYEFTGYIDLIEDNTNNALPGIHTNQVFHGWFSYLEVPNTGTYPGYGRYFQDASIGVTFDSLTLSYLNDFVYVLVLDNYSSVGDRFSFGVDAKQGSYSYTNFGLRLTDSSGKVFDSDALPISFDLAQFDSTRFILSGTKYPEFDRFDIEGQITSLRLIPEPGAVLLFGIGAIGLLRKRR